MTLRAPMPRPAVGGMVSVAADHGVTVYRTRARFDERRRAVPLGSLRCARTARGPATIGASSSGRRSSPSSSPRRLTSGHRGMRTLGGGPRAARPSSGRRRGDDEADQPAQHADELG